MNPSVSGRNADSAFARSAIRQQWGPHLWSRFRDVALGGLAGFVIMGMADPAPMTIRTRGIVVEDSLGRPRIALGAPLATVVEHGPSAGTTGIIIYDTAGRPMTAIGINNPNISTTGVGLPRAGATAGLTIYDLRTGRERGGMGAFSDGRANVCLDYGDHQDKEAVCMVVAPSDQYTAVLLNAHPTSDAFDRVVMYTDASGASSIKAVGSKANRNGVFLQAGGGQLRAILYDSAAASRIVTLEP